MLVCVDVAPPATHLRLWHTLGGLQSASFSHAPPTLALTSSPPATAASMIVKSGDLCVGLIVRSFRSARRVRSTASSRCAAPGPASTPLAAGTLRAAWPHGAHAFRSLLNTRVTSFRALERQEGADDYLPAQLEIEAGHEAICWPSTIPPRKVICAMTEQAQPLDRNRRPLCIASEAFERLAPDTCGVACIYAHYTRWLREASA